MNQNLLTTIVLRQHLQRAYDELGEELWPILQRVIRELAENTRVNDQDRFEYEVREP